MIQPNFFVIGAAKCGTTSLCSLLSQHPEIFFSPDKEPRFFSHDGNYEKGPRFYEASFADADKEKCIGEGSTTYSESWLNRAEKSASRIYDYCPEAKIIYCVRSPLEQIESKWLDFLVSIDSGLQSRELIRAKVLEITGDFNIDIKRNPDFINTANYLKQLRTYRKYFKPENIEIVFFEDFKIRPSLVMERVCDFLGVSSEFIFKDPKRTRNKSSEKGLSTGFGKVMRSFPGYGIVAKNSPEGIRRIISPFTKKKFAQRPVWNNALREQAINILKDDTDSFLDYCNKPCDYWQSLI